MKRSLSWIMVVLAVSVLCSVDAGATVPFADDIPDVRLFRQGVADPDSATEAFDLDSYVIDNNNSSEALTWTVDAPNNPNVVINANDTVDVGAFATAGAFAKTYTVTDPDLQTSQDVSYVKYSDIWLTAPTLTSDHRIALQRDLPAFTYVLLNDGSGGSQVVTPALTPYPLGTAAEFGPLNVWNIESGSPVLAGSGNTVNAAGLGAALNVSTGEVALTPSAGLTAPVLIAIPVVLQGSSVGDSGNWDGQVILVAPASSIASYPAVADEYAAGGPGTKDLAIITGFDGDFATAAEVTLPNPATQAVVEPGGAGSTANSVFIGPGWRTISPADTFAQAEVSLITSAQLAATTAGDVSKQFPGATSGNVLRITAQESEDIGINSFRISDVEPGEIYGISLNISTDLDSTADAAYADLISMKLQAYSSPDFGQTTAASYQKFDAAANPDVGTTFGFPTDGNWIQMYTEFRVPELNRAVDNSAIGGSGTNNFAPYGFQVIYSLLVRDDSAATLPAFNVYIDNIYIYKKGMSDLNFFDANDDEDPAVPGTLALGGLIENGLANGVTAIPNPYLAVNGTAFDSSFDSGATLDANGFRLQDTGQYDCSDPSCPLAVGTSELTFDVTSVRARNQVNGIGNSLRAQFPGAASRTGILSWRAASRAVPLNGLDTNNVQLQLNGEDLEDLSGPGIYGVSFWIASDAASVVDVPSLKVNLQEVRPTNLIVFGVNYLQPTTVPTAADGWHQYYFVLNVPDVAGVGNAMERAILSFTPLALTSYRNITLPEYGPYVGAQSPGQDGDAAIYVDDAKIHKVRDSAIYFDYNLFN